jgi:hypothetical protein
VIQIKLSLEISKKRSHFEIEVLKNICCQRNLFSKKKMVPGGGKPARHIFNPSKQEETK